MTVNRIGLSYTGHGGGDAYQVLFRDFADNSVPRQYSGDASFVYGLAGSTQLDGPAYRQKYVWVISAYLNAEQAKDLNDLFKTWDADRAQGYPAACGLIDETFFDTVTTNVVFATPPEFVRINPNYFSASVGLNEV